MSLPSRLLRLHLPASVSSCARSAPFLPAGRRPVLFLVRPDNPDQHLFHRNLTQEFPLQEITLLFFLRHFVLPPLYQHTQESLSNMPLLSFSPDRKQGSLPSVSRQQRPLLFITAHLTCAMSRIQHNTHRTGFRFHIHHIAGRLRPCRGRRDHQNDNHNNFRSLPHNFHPVISFIHVMKYVVKSCLASVTAAKAAAAFSP